MAHSCPIDRPCPKKTWAMQVVAVVSAGTAAAMAWIVKSGAIDRGEKARLWVLLIVAMVVLAGAVWRVVHVRRVGRMGWSEMAGPVTCAAFAAGLIVIALVFVVAG